MYKENIRDYSNSAFKQTLVHVCHGFKTNIGTVFQKLIKNSKCRILFLLGRFLLSIKISETMALETVMLLEFVDNGLALFPVHLATPEGK